MPQLTYDNGRQKSKWKFSTFESSDVTCRQGLRLFAVALMYLFRDTELVLYSYISIRSSPFRWPCLWLYDPVLRLGPHNVGLVCRTLELRGQKEFRCLISCSIQIYVSFNMYVKALLDTILAHDFLQLPKACDTRCDKLDVTCRLRSWFEKVGCGIR